MLWKLFNFIIEILPILIGIILLLPLLFCVLFFILFAPKAKWQYVENLTLEDKQAFANMALMPEMANSITRYGTMGFQDVDAKIETCTFRDIDELCQLMPEGSKEAIEKTLSGIAEQNAQKIVTYRIASEDLPLAIREINDNNFGERYYFILVYPDGGYSLEIIVPLKALNDQSQKSNGYDLQALKRPPSSLLFQKWRG